MNWTLDHLNPVMRKQAREKLAEMTKGSTVRKHVCQGPIDAPTKHHSIKTAVGDLKFDSKWEAACWFSLQARQERGEIRNLRRQVKFSLFMHGGEHYGTYAADFVFEEYDGEKWVKVVADAKSAHTARLQAWQKTKSLMRNNHNIFVRELFKRGQR